LTNAVIAAACGSTVLAAWPGISSLPRSVIGPGLLDRCRDRCAGCFDRDPCGSLAHRCKKHGGCLALRCRGHGGALTDHGVVGSGRAVPGPLPGPPPGPGASHFVFGPCGKQMVGMVLDPRVCGLHSGCVPVQTPVLSCAGPFSGRRGPTTRVAPAECE
jgi:hypothetical protein